MNASTGTLRGRARWAAWMALAIAGLKELGPYAAIEIILPGGTLIALAIWLYRRRAARIAQAARAGKSPRPLVSSYSRNSCATCA
jgi:hypothetical protein